MIKKMLLALCLMFSAEARAQFAAGYAPVRPEAAPSGEEQQSVLFRQAPAPAEAAPRPAEPENIRKPTPYTGSIRMSTATSSPPKTSTIGCAPSA